MENLGFDSFDVLVAMIFLTGVIIALSVVEGVVDLAIWVKRKVKWNG